MAIISCLALYESDNEKHKVSSARECQHSTGILYIISIRSVAHVQLFATSKPYGHGCVCCVLWICYRRRSRCSASPEPVGDQPVAASVAAEDSHRKKKKKKERRRSLEDHEFYVDTPAPNQIPNKSFHTPTESDKKLVGQCKGFFHR